MFFSLVSIRLFQAALSVMRLSSCSLYGLHAKHQTQVHPCGGFCHYPDAGCAALMRSSGLDGCGRAAFLFDAPRFTPASASSPLAVCDREMPGRRLGIEELSRGTHVPLSTPFMVAAVNRHRVDDVRSRFPLTFYKDGSIFVVECLGESAGVPRFHLLERRPPPSLRRSVPRASASTAFGTIAVGAPSKANEPGAC